MHPKGAELVVCTAGEITLHQEIRRRGSQGDLARGEAIVNPPGVWHTADVDGTATAFFVTAGVGTENRPR
jgi:quercetin dioxygenase-like cupin family protein